LAGYAGIAAPSAPARPGNEIARLVRAKWGIAKKRLTLDKGTAEPYIVNDGKVRWDDNKAAANIAAHGVTLESARDVFRDPFALDRLDESEDYGEVRYAVIGMAEGRLLYVAYTTRGEAIRIISASPMNGDNTIRQRLRRRNTIGAASTL
jgi:uncharacterized protein